MKEANTPLETLHEIRDMMEKSSRFLSLSGLSGVFAGLFALAGAGAAYAYLGIGVLEPAYRHYAYRHGRPNPDFINFFLLDATLVLVAALVAGIYFTARKARSQGQSLWGFTARRLVFSMMIPLVAGGLFCLALIYHGAFALAAPATLIFYGLALLNGSKYTLHDVRYLGITEIILGVLASFFIGYGLLCWAVGFGLMHILYGAIMYYKYER
jgi:hypothetical protein